LYAQKYVHLARRIEKDTVDDGSLLRDLDTARMTACDQSKDEPSELATDATFVVAQIYINTCKILLQ